VPAEAITKSPPIGTTMPWSPGTVVPRRPAQPLRWSDPPRVFARALGAMPPSSWLLLDATMLAVWLVLGFRLYPPPLTPESPYLAPWPAVAVFTLSLIVPGLVFGLYERQTLLSRAQTLMRMSLTVLACGVLSHAVVYVVMYATVSRKVSFTALSLFLVGGVLIRFLAHRVIQQNRRGLLLVGPRALFDSFVAAKRAGFLSEYDLHGHADAGPAGEPLTAHASPPDFGPIASCVDRLRSQGVTDVVVGSQAAGDKRDMGWLRACLEEGLRVTNEAIFYEKATGQILVDQITPTWFLFADLEVHCEERATLKRTFDVLAGLVGILLTAPLWPIIALAILLDDGAPVLYSQDRVGQHGRVFRLYKFRTMRRDAECGRSVWACRDDPRVTRVGRWLRRTRLDELPQFYNILRGQMSVVGPRPERPDLVERLCHEVPYYAERHLVKPGLTGWAQISYQYGASVEDAQRKLQFDLYYLKHMSTELDVVILLRTIGTFLRGAR
jgi:sugar transferase (PEP-CTERM system associated)